MDQKGEGTSRSRLLGFVQPWLPLLTLLATIGIAMQNNRVQMQLAELRIKQDRDLEQVRRELSSPKMVVTKGASVFTDDNHLSSIVDVLNSSGSEAQNVRITLSSTRPVRSVHPRFPHQHAPIDQSSDARSVLININTLSVGETLSLEITFPVLPNEAIQISERRATFSNFIPSDFITVNALCTNCISPSIVTEASLTIERDRIVPTPTIFPKPIVPTLVPIR